MKKFYIGADIGTDSVGIACTDENYNLLRAKGTDLWAVRLFDSANDAKERRAKRTARRRLERRKQRIGFLQEVFSNFLEDELFFIRLNNSTFYEEDKDEKLKSRFALFADADFTDKDFYIKFPTIYHLRKYLTEQSDSPRDLRLYYLAFHHIVKYRGHFLFEGDDVSDVSNLGVLFDKVNNICSDLFEQAPIYLSKEKAEDFKEIAMSKTGLNDKKNRCLEIFGENLSQQGKEFITLLLGGKVKPAVMFGEDVKDVNSFSFREISDDGFLQMQADLGDDRFELLSTLRDIYNFIVFEKILGGNKLLSSAMIKLYEKHKEDLEKLKNILRNDRDSFAKMFKDTKQTANYVNYIGWTKIGGKKVNVKKCKSKEDFYKTVKVAIAEYQTTQSKEILTDIEAGVFMPKILNADNGVFPKQINYYELNKILENLCREYPEFLTEEDGVSFAEKIKLIFNYKIPYYIGPLNKNSANSWVVRKPGQVTPWNFDKIIDKKASNKEFIRRMTNKCSYLHCEDVLPKCSIFYQKYDVLNQINKMTINEQPITVSQKQKIFDQLFLKEGKVTKKRIIKFITDNGWWNTETEGELIIGGFDEEIKASMKSYVTLKKILGHYVDSHVLVCENIILWHSICTDKNMLEELVLENYGTDIEIKNNIKAIKGITSFKDFGKLSKKLLCELSGGIDQTTGEIKTILNELYNTNKNFNEIYYGEEYSFKSNVEKSNNDVEREITYDDIDNLYVSPLVKRGIWQTLKMIDEYVEAVGRAPDKIFIEVTRQDGKKERTKSRKNAISELYKNITRRDLIEIDEFVEKLNGKTDAQLRQERLYLYFTQLGRCAYTGEEIDLAQLSSDLYDVDHIMPQSITKDDSLDNKVLVLRTKNAEKSDTYPLPNGFANTLSLWKLLKEKRLMSEKKFALLTRTKQLTEEDFQEFVNRQIVVTNQTVKAVAELLTRKFEGANTKIVYSKAKNVSNFRQKFNIIKCRETNDLHHARDAYLNVVVGNVYDSKFTNASSYFYQKGDVWKEYSLKTLFHIDINGAWDKEKTLATVKKTVSKCSMKVTRFSYKSKGEFYDQMASRKDENPGCPIKESIPYGNMDKYGGYKSVSNAYFAIVESEDKKGNRKKTIESVPVIIDYKIKGDENKLVEYFIKQGLKNPKILVKQLNLKTLISVDGFRAWISGLTGKQIVIHNAVQWFTDSDVDCYVNGLGKYVELERKNALSESEIVADSYNVYPIRKGEGKLFITKNANLELFNLICETLDKKVYLGCSAMQSFKGKIASLKEKFENATCLEQSKVLLQIIKILKCNAELANLTLLGDGANCGKILLGSDITNKDFAIIHQSPCGLYERVVKI